MERLLGAIPLILTTTMVAGGCMRGRAHSVGANTRESQGTPSTQSAPQCGQFGSVAPSNTVAFDWASQIRGVVEYSVGRATLTAVPSNILNVSADAVSVRTPVFDNPSISYHRSVTLRLAAGCNIPNHTKARNVVLSTEVGGVVAPFFHVGSTYILQFTLRGELFDVLDSSGESGLANDLSRPGSIERDGAIHR
jgi:hypothetical protein